MEATTPVTDTSDLRESSPQAVRLSLAAAMTLGLKPGRFYRDARLKCINLLQTYPGRGCVGRCAYCGLSRGRNRATTKSRSFIRVSWPTYRLDEVIDRMERHSASFGRVCLSMITHQGALKDFEAMARDIRSRLDVPISALVTPTLVDRAGFKALRSCGVDRIGIAVDAATPALFDEHRGRGQSKQSKQSGRGRGPHSWDRYWEGLAEAAEVFGPFMAGCHLIVGLGETEQEMIETLGRVRAFRCLTHLFSFFPEAGSQLENHPKPSMGHYRRIQLARYLIDEGLDEASAMTFDESGRLRSYGADEAALERTIASGEPFRTSGCPDVDGEVACNRPFANSRPGPNIRNYPFALEPDDVAKVRAELWT